MNKKRFQSQSGLSLVEILIILTVIAILTTIALTQLGNSKVDLQRQRIAREFKVYLERARFDSVKRRAEAPNQRARITLNSSTSFSVAIDFNENGQIDAGEIRQVNFADRSNARILISDSFNYPVTISFNQRGHISATDAANNPVNPVFTICSNNCLGTSQDAIVISVSTTGTVAILKGGESPSALPVPSPISSATPQFNCYMLVNSNSTSCINK